MMQDNYTYHGEQFLIYICINVNLLYATHLLYVNYTSSGKTKKKKKKEIACVTILP